MDKFSFCPLCETTGTTREVRRHMFENHYDYVLLQMNGDLKKLKRWMELED